MCSCVFCRAALFIMKLPRKIHRYRRYLRMCREMRNTTHAIDRLEIRQRYREMQLDKYRREFDGIKS